MERDGSKPVRIADETLANGPQCSPDGKWVVYLRGPSWIPMRVSITGGAPQEIAKDSVVSGSTALYLGSYQYSAAISPDGKSIAYLTVPDSAVENPGSPSASRPNRLKIIPFEGGMPSYQFDWPPSAGEHRWAHDGKAVEYVLTRNGVSNIWQQPLTGRPPKQITNFKSGLIFDFAWSVDGSQLALTRGNLSSGVVLLSNFQ